MSLAAHLVFLLEAPLFLMAAHPDSATLLVATLTAAHPQVPVSASALERSSPRREMRRAEQSPPSAAARLPTSANQSSPANAGLPVRSDNQPAAPADGQTPIERGLAASVPGSASQETAAEGLPQYRLALAREARRFKRYPVLARDRGWEGSVEVHLILAANLPVPLVSLGRSSGFEALDRQALETIGEAARRTVVPEGLRGRDLRLTIPVEFSLAD